MATDPRVERQRIAAAFGTIDRLPECADGGTVSRLVTTVAITTYPTTAGVFYGANPTELDGDEIEGGSASPTADTTQVIYVFNQGTQVPPVGTVVVAHRAGGRWVMRYDG